MFIDSHTHIHDSEYPLDRDQVMSDSSEVEGHICVGTDYRFSEEAVVFAQKHPGSVWASIGLHPHDASSKKADLEMLSNLASNKQVVAVGECGLDYHYMNSPKEEQQEALLRQFELADEFNLPMIFHIRGAADNLGEVFEDFWKLYDQFKPRGVVHSFTGQPDEADQILSRNLFIGVNGIATFMKPGPQAEAIAKIPLEKMLLETDAPYLTPAPFRGKINEPKYLRAIAGFIAEQKGTKIEEVARITSDNAVTLFGLKNQ